MPPEEEHQQGELETPPEPATVRAPETPPAPPKPELRIVDFSEKKINPFCSICGLEKDRFVEVEVKGVIEYTCRDCYRRSRGGPAIPPAMSCRRCGAAMVIGDNFCGKCGAPAVLRCTACNNEVDEEDMFCAKCGAKLFSGD